MHAIEARQPVRKFGDVVDVPRETFAVRSGELLAMVDLTDEAGRQIRTRSLRALG